MNLWSENRTSLKKKKKRKSEKVRKGNGISETKLSVDKLKMTLKLESQQEKLRRSVRKYQYSSEVTVPRMVRKDPCLLGWPPAPGNVGSTEEWLWFLERGHGGRCCFRFGLLALALGEATCHVMKTLRQPHGENWLASISSWPCDLAILEVDLPAEVQTLQSSDQGSLSEYPITVLWAS